MRVADEPSSRRLLVTLDLFCGWDTASSEEIRVDELMLGEVGETGGGDGGIGIHPGGFVIPWERGSSHPRISKAEGICSNRDWNWSEDKNKSETKY